MPPRAGQPSLSPTGTSTQIYTVVPEELRTIIDRAADQMDVSRSEVVRDALVYFLAHEMKYPLTELRAALGRPMMASSVIRQALGDV